MADQSALAAKASAFRDLHHGPEMLVLPNVWDAVSAKLVEAAGFRAIATSSAGVAFTLGYPDGQRIPRAEMLAAVERIARATHLPVSADLEHGYGEGPKNAACLARELFAAGAIGLNLEDGTGHAARPFKGSGQQVEEIQSIREAGGEAGVAVVINARTDVFWKGKATPEERLSDTAKRCVAYRDAGADCLFVPGLRDAQTIAALVREVAAPLNVLAGPGVPPLAELEQRGVRRVSFGSGLMRACLGYLRGLLIGIKASVNSESLLQNAASGEELNNLFANRA